MRLSEKIDWNDLRLLLVISETGQVGSTAERMGIDPTTVTRRLRKLENHAGVKLIERIRGGVVLSPACSELLKSAKMLDRALDDVSANIASEASMGGLIRITMVDFMVTLLAEKFAELQQAHPKLMFDFRESYFKHSLENKEADIAIRFGEKPNEGLVGTRHTINCSVWGIPKFQKQKGEWPWLAWNLAHNNLDAWIDEVDSKGKIIHRSSSVISQANLVAQGMGVASLPDIWVTQRKELSHLVKLHPGFESVTWVLTPEELRHIPRIHSTVRLITDYLRQYK